MNKNEFIKLFKSKNAPDIILHYCIEKGKNKNQSLDLNHQQLYEYCSSRNRICRISNRNLPV